MSDVSIPMEELFRAAGKILIERARKIVSAANSMPDKRMFDLARVRLDYWKEAVDVLNDPDFQEGVRVRCGVVKLQTAVHDALREPGTLPRCEHGSALRDHSGEALEPSCGCRS